MNKNESAKSITKEKKNEKRFQRRIENEKTSEIDKFINALNNKKSRTIEQLKPMKSLIQTEPPEMVLYSVYGKSFDTKEEAKLYCQRESISTDRISSLAYIRKFAGRSDVIKESIHDESSIIYTAVDGDGYGIYNHQRSLNKKTFIWEFNYGSIEELYTPFRERGIIFENDIYTKISDRNKQLIKLCNEQNLFHTKKPQQ